MLITLWSASPVYIWIHCKTVLHEFFPNLCFIGYLKTYWKVKNFACVCRCFVIQTWLFEPWAGVGFLTGLINHCLAQLSFCSTRAGEYIHRWKSAEAGKLDHSRIAVLLFLLILIYCSQLICCLTTTGCMTPLLPKEHVCVLIETLRHSLLDTCQSKHWCFNSVFCLLNPTCLVLNPWQCFFFHIKLPLW